MEQQERIRRANEDRPPKPIDPVERAAAVEAMVLRYPLELHPTLRWLIERFPFAFAPEDDRVRPLKIGIDREVLAIAAVEASWVTADDLRRVLGRWVAAPLYRFNLRRGKRRRNLDGLRCECQQSSLRTKTTLKKAKIPAKRAALEADRLRTEASESLQKGVAATGMQVADAIGALLRSATESDVPWSELSELWLRLRRAKRSNKRHRHEDSQKRAQTLLSANDYAKLHALAVARGDDAIAGFLADELERLANALDENEVQLMRRSLRLPERRRLGTARAVLQEDMSKLSSLLAATPSVAKAFFDAARVELSAQAFARITAIPGSAARA